MESGYTIQNQNLFMMSIRNAIVFALFSMSLFLYSCSKDSLEDPVTVQEPSEEPPAEPPSERIIWSGTATTFSKASDADPSQAENQDRITEKVWITRGNDGGEIYNAQSESTSAKGVSPRGTAWAIGTLDQIDQLEFKNFRAAVGNPKDVVGKDLVLHLVEDNIYLSVKFTSWAQGKAGGFAYQRSTEN
jgi:hypothetical protein